MSRGMWLAVFGVLVTAGIGWGELHWIEWDGADWPENMDPAWIRSWGNWQGPHQGGAYRTLDDGVLTYDSLYDPGVYDFYYMDLPGLMSLGPSQEFVIECRLLVDEVIGPWYYDPCVGIQSDDSWGVGLVFNTSTVFSDEENVIVATFAPGEFHSFQLRSSDMRTYHLTIDSEPRFDGVFTQGVSSSWVSWGDGVQGAASLHHWDYLRFGVVSALTGDVNCDGTLDFRDINPFVGVLSAPGGIELLPPGCPVTNADINQDGSIDFSDINPFVQLMVR